MICEKTRSHCANKYVLLKNPTDSCIGKCKIEANPTDDMLLFRLQYAIIYSRKSVTDTSDATNDGKDLIKIWIFKVTFLIILKNAEKRLA